MAGKESYRDDAGQTHRSENLLPFNGYKNKPNEEPTRKGTNNHTRPTLTDNTPLGQREEYIEQIADHIKGWPQGYECLLRILNNVYDPDALPLAVLPTVEILACLQADIIELREDIQEQDIPRKYTTSNGTQCQTTEYKSLAEMQTKAEFMSRQLGLQKMSNDPRGKVRR